MKPRSGGIRLAIGALALALAGTAGAQENLDLGKSAAQLYASDCAICHKSPQKLSRPGGVFGLEGFLREHYTASRESAAVIAAYLKGLERAAPDAPARSRSSKRTAKGEERGKQGEGKQTEKKPEAGKAGEGNSTGAKPAEPKSTDAKPAEKPANAMPSEAKASEPKPVRDATPEKSE